MPKISSFEIAAASPRYQWVKWTTWLSTKSHIQYHMPGLDISRNATCPSYKIEHFSIQIIWFRRKFCENALARLAVLLAPANGICWAWCVYELHDCSSVIPNAMVNTLRPRQNGCHLADDIFKSIFVNENVKISITSSLKFAPKSPINNIQALVQIMAWRRPGDKPSSEPMMASSLLHICITRRQWIN